MPREPSSSPKDGSEEEKKSSWSEHVWSTFIHRGFTDDVTDMVSRAWNRTWISFD
jgi:hypothetical protein